MRRTNKKQTKNKTKTKHCANTHRDEFPLWRNAICYLSRKYHVLDTDKRLEAIRMAVIIRFRFSCYGEGSREGKGRGREGGREGGKER